MRQEATEQQLEALVERNLVLEKELQDKDNKYLDLYEENNALHEDMLELQDQLEEAFGDDLSEIGLDEDGSGGKGSSGGIKVPGAKTGKKAMKSLIKTLKKTTKKKKDKKKE